MMAPRKTYRLADPVSDVVQKILNSYTPLLQQLLYNRGIREADAAEKFLNPSYDEHLHDPFLFADMEVAVARVLTAITKNEHVTIYSDYDCDGIPGGVVLHDFFEAIGYSNFDNYIPHRHDEGYGFNPESVTELKSRGTSVVVTVDCGIVDVEAVAEANKEGMDVIVTDHHEPGAVIPEAYAILNPKHGDTYPFTGLCGAGVAYKFVQALIARGKEQGMFELKDGWEKWWLDMVGIATIADMVPLTDENRVLARYGLQVLRKSRRPGLQHLLKKAGGSQRHLSEDDIGFTIGPRINAASRMDTPEEAFHMLRTKDEGEAGELVRRLESLNNERKGTVAAMTKEVKKRMKQVSELPPVIVMGNPEWRPSLVGLVANALTEEYRRPAFLWGRDGRDVIKGSCRSDGVTSVLALMEATPDSFLQFGGHHASGGFSVSSDKIHTLVDDLSLAHGTVVESVKDQYPEEGIDAEITLDQIDVGLLRILRELAPFGVGNAKPLFRIADVSPTSVEVFGKIKNHTKLRFETQGVAREAIAFFTTPDQFDPVPEVGKAFTLIAHIEESYFMGRMQTRLRIVDVV